MKTFLFIPLILVSILSVAQRNYVPGYIITNKADTVKGFINNISNKSKQSECLFKETESSEVKAFSPQDIKAYWIQGDIYYESKRVRLADGQIKTVFAEVLVKGKASLLLVNEEFYLEHDSLHRIPQGNKLPSTSTTSQQTVNAKKYIGTLRALTLDCPPVGVDFNRVRYNQSDFVKVAQKYNDCLHSQYYTYKKGLASNKVSFRLVGGLNMSKVVFKNLPAGTFDLATSAFGGAGIELSSPQAGSRINFLFEIWYSKNSFKGVSEHQRLTYEKQVDTYEINVNYLRIPVGIKYYLSKGNVSSYLKAGLSYYIFSKKSESKLSQVRVNTQDNSSENISDGYAALVNSGQFTGWAGPGLQFNMGDKMKLSTEVQYEVGSGVVRSADINNKFNNIIFLLAVSF
jgi:hypothetical protein